MRKFTLILIIVCLNGCINTDNIRTNNIDGAKKFGSPPGMAAYVQGQRPPALESVEVWENRYGPGLKLTSAHYEIYTTLLDPFTLCRINNFMESAYRAYNSQLPEYVETDSKSPIYLFDKRRHWEQFTRRFTGEQAEMFCRIKAGAYCHNRACVAYNIGRKRTFSALGHEGWHQFNDKHFKFRMPSWLDEGTAMLFETHGSQGGMYHFVPSENKYRLSMLKKTILKDKMIPLKELIEMNPGDVLAIDETEAVMAFYSQSYALVRFLQEARYGLRLNIYRRLLADGLEGAWPLDEMCKKIAADRSVPKSVQWNKIVGRGLFERYISKDLDRIEQEYLLFCKQIAGNSN